MDNRIKNMRKPICLRIKEALEVLPNKNSPFYKELSKYENINDWLIEGDSLDENGNMTFYILEDSAENNKVISQHQQFDLNNI